jgi:hypothetical protein
VSATNVRRKIRMARAAVVKRENRITLAALADL